MKKDEEELLADVLNLAGICGWRRLHIRPARTRAGWRTPVAGDGKGFPDVLLLRGARLLVAELKSDDGATTAEQELWLAAFRAAGVETYVWTPADWPQIVKALQGLPREAHTP